MSSEKPAAAGFSLLDRAIILDGEACKMQTASGLVVIHIVLPGTCTRSLILSHATKNKHFFCGGII